jgi:hypothetical protein
VNDYLVVHEQVHFIQQRDYQDNSNFFKKLFNRFFVSKTRQWWNRYINDRQFRIMQELEAYAYEYKAFCTRVTNRDARSRYLHGIASNLSSKLYGNVMNYSDAMAAMRKGTKDII